MASNTATLLRQWRVTLLYFRSQMHTRARSGQEADNERIVSGRTEGGRRFPGVHLAGLNGRGPKSSSESGQNCGIGTSAEDAFCAQLVRARRLAIAARLGEHPASKRFLDRI